MAVKEPMSFQDFVKVIEQMPLSFTDFCVLLGYRSPNELREALLQNELSVWHINGVLAAAFPLAVASGWPEVIRHWPAISHLMLRGLQAKLPVCTAKDLEAAVTRGNGGPWTPPN